MPPTNVLPLGLGSSKIVLTIKGQHIPGFKNRKLAIKDKKSGKMRTLTEPSVKARTEAITQSFVSQLLSACQTIEPETLPGCSKLFWIASLLPEDDSWFWIPSQKIDCEMVLKGEEGCEMIVELIA